MTLKLARSSNVTASRRQLIGALCLSGAVLAAVLVDRAGGWDAALYRVRWEYRLRVAPGFWPRDSFTKEEWQRSPDGERYRLVRDLLDRRLLDRKTEQEVVGLLGGRLAGSDTALYEVRKEPEGNLWFVLCVEYSGGRVETARLTLAFLDP